MKSISGKKARASSSVKSPQLKRKGRANTPAKNTKKKVTKKTKKKVTPVKMNTKKKSKEMKRRKVELKSPNKKDKHKLTPPSPKLKSPKKSPGLATPPSLKSRRFITLPQLISSSGSSQESPNNNEDEQLPSPMKINWTSASDLGQVLVINDSSLDLEDVKAYSFEEKVKQVGMLYAPSKLIMPFTRLAVQHSIPIDNIDAGDFSTRAKGVAKMTDLLLKIVSNEETTE